MKKLSKKTSKKAEQKSCAKKLSEKAEQKRRAKGRASFSGKGAAAAKRWVLQELEKGHQPEEPNQESAKNFSLPLSLKRAT